MSQIERIVDAHVHFWDPARREWYPYLSGGRELGMGNISAMCRRFGPAEYLAEARPWNVVKVVHVAAATSTFTLDETSELDVLARLTGRPDAIIGGVDPGLPDAQALSMLDAQLSSPRFRGVRPMGGMEGAVLPDALLAGLVERGLVFDMMAKADQLEHAAKRLAAWGELTVVTEHAGWPRTNTAEEFAMWKVGITRLAQTSANIYCKLSGLAMPLGSMDTAAFRPWIEHCLEAFGVDRCMFASNFPVDGLHGSLSQLYATYDALVAHLDDESHAKLFALNAEKVYRC